MLRSLRRLLGIDPEDGFRPRSCKTRGIEVRRTVCCFCSCGCGMNASVKDGRLLSLEGDPVNPINEGTLCSKGAAAAGLHRSDDRLTTPRIREPGAADFRPATWDEALDRIAARWSDILRRTWKPEAARSDALGMLGGAVNTNEEAYSYRKLAGPGRARLRGASGPHLTLVHGPGSRVLLRLRCFDQPLQGLPERALRPDPGQQHGREPPDGDEVGARGAAPRRHRDRRRPQVQPHRRARRSVRAHPAGRRLGAHRRADSPSARARPVRPRLRDPGDQRRALDRRALRLRRRTVLGVRRCRRALRPGQLELPP